MAIRGEIEIPDIRLEAGRPSDLDSVRRRWRKTLDPEGSVRASCRRFGNFPRRISNEYNRVRNVGSARVLNRPGKLDFLLTIAGGSREQQRHQCGY